ncbi:putative pentatricopeptide repeat-containing protein At3g25970 [Silene latifolia]|uniref:putative pentatricopeptide repeat-containing protein At3g25970 n=1 Tax=Silene latifolia TaxID=37657 RepID=UPI003D7894E8
MSKFQNLHCRPTLKVLKELITKNLHGQALKTSLSSSSPSLTDQTYSLFIKSGHVLDTFLATSLISHFSKAGDFSRSRRFLFDAPRVDTIAFNALLSGYAQFHHPCFSLYTTMLSDYRLMPDSYTLSSLIKSCDNLNEIMIAHVICIKLGFNRSGVLVSGMINKYGKFGCVESAEKCFEECGKLDSVVCTSMINGFVLNYEFEKGKDVFRRMGLLGLGLTEFSLTAVVRALREIKEGELIHGFSLKVGYRGSLHLCNVIMNMYARCGSRYSACKMFDEIPYPDVVSWTARIGAASDSGDAINVFKFMHSNNLETNELTFVNVLSGVEDPKLLFAAKQVHSFCHKAGFLSVISVVNALLSMYQKCGVMDEARRVFDEMALRDSISWNSLIGGYSETGLVSTVLQLLSQMRCIGIRPDQYTLASVLGGVEGADFAILVMQIHSYMIKTGLTLDGSMASCLISSYGKCYSFDCAKRVLGQLAEAQEIDVGHFQVMAASAIAAGRPLDALECFKSSMLLCSETNGDIFSIVLKACSALTNLGQGKAIHSLALKSGLGTDMFVETSIIDFYCKCGCISDAQTVFLDTSTGNLAAWNAMIMGYAQHGCYPEVIALFDKMTEQLIKPDEITYLGILQSCCHAGLVNEAQIHLNTMYEIHGLVPCLEHYSSIIDMMGRVGLVKEAKLVIDQMPISPDAYVWQSLLSACNNAGELEIGEVAARELVKLQPENESAYILLSNLYAKACDWEGVRRLRKEMKEKLIYKEAGSSWTEIGGSMSQFRADDISHPDIEKIYFYLQTLADHILPPTQTLDDCFASVDCC